MGALLLVTTWAGSPGRRQLRSAEPASAPLVDQAQTRATTHSLIKTALDRSPRRYDGRWRWERTKRVWAGVKLRRDGLRLRTENRWRELRHGLQCKYWVRFPGDPMVPPPVEVQVRSVRRNHPPSGGWQLDCQLATPLDFSARIERWNLGLQWYSVEVSGHMEVRLEMVGDLDAYPDYSEVPPAIVVDPDVKRATVHLDALHVDRISKVGGEVAEQWGELVEKIAQEILLDEFNARLAARMNEAIEKKRERLRFSSARWWNRMEGASPE